MHKHGNLVKNETFKASNDWLMIFLRRHGITFQEVYREKRSEQINHAIDWWQRNVKEVFLKYAPEDIHKADEAGVFFNSYTIEH